MTPGGIFLVKLTPDMTIEPLSTPLNTNLTTLPIVLINDSLPVVTVSYLQPPSLSEQGGRVMQSSCANGVLDDSEECDDGNFSDGDGCDALCRVEDHYMCEKDGEGSRCEQVSIVIRALNWVAFGMCAAATLFLLGN